MCSIETAPRVVAEFREPLLGCSNSILRYSNPWLIVNWNSDSESVGMICVQPLMEVTSSQHAEN